jgi:hypothetical protein
VAVGEQGQAVVVWAARSLRLHTVCLVSAMLGETQCHVRAECTCAHLTKK